MDYSAIVTRFGGLDKRHNVVILTDNEMKETARRMQIDSAAFVGELRVINLDETEDFSAIYALKPEDLVILHIGIESWVGRHGKMAFAFNKPEGVAAKYICVRPTITAKALLEGLNTPVGLTEGIVEKYGDLPKGEVVSVKSKSGTDITLTLAGCMIIPFNTHKPGANAYLPPAEISYDLELGTAKGVIVADVTVGELRVNGDLINPFGLVDVPVTLYIKNGEIADISGGEMAKRLKTELWKLSANCRKIVEFGIGLSKMSPSGIIGIDESIAGTCHFGFGSPSGNDAAIHLDVVINDFDI